MVLYQEDVEASRKNKNRQINLLVCEKVINYLC